MCSVFSGVPAPGRPPGQRHGSAWPAPAAAEQCSVLNGQGLPPRAGSGYEDDLRAYGAGRYVPTAPTDLRAFAAQLDLITASEYEDALRACANMNDLRACIAMMDLFISRMDDEDEARENELLCAQAVHSLVAQERPCAQDKDNMQQFLEEQELWLAEDHIAFGAASRIQNDEDEARENELLCVQAVHSLVAQERPCAQDKDNAQHLEQENDGLHPGRDQARLHRGCAAGGGSFRSRASPPPSPSPPRSPRLGVFCERELDTNAAAEPEMGVFCEHELDTTAAAKIFAVALQDLHISKSTAADAPTGSTLNKPESESRAFTAGLRPQRLRRQERQPHRLLPPQGQGWPPRTHPD